VLHFILQTTQPGQPAWDEGVIHIIGYVWTLIGGTAGLLALLAAIKSLGLTDKLKVALETQRNKINEVAEKNPADITPLPPPDANVAPPPAKAP
jgi:hypothetical protein